MLRRRRNWLLRVEERSPNIEPPEQGAMMFTRRFLSARDRLAAADSP